MILQKQITMTIRVTILKFERIDEEEYRSKAYSQDFFSSHTLWDVNEWIKKTDPTKDISNAYFQIIQDDFTETNTNR